MKEERDKSKPGSILVSNLGLAMNQKLKGNIQAGMVRLTGSIENAETSSRIGLDKKKTSRSRKQNNEENAKILAEMTLEPTPTRRTNTRRM